MLRSANDSPCDCALSTRGENEGEPGPLAGEQVLFEISDDKNYALIKVAQRSQEKGKTCV
jgi:hypothetical protein